ncbi:MAG: hypothetical protein U0359_40965 [Byssovorax sp.]
MQTLADRISRDGPIKELDAVGWAIRLAKRLEALHALGVAHGSVSTHCIMTAGVERTAKAHIVDVQHSTTVASFHSPERIMGGDISTADDTWAVAVTLYTALTGTNPFGAPKDQELRHRILAAAPTPLAVFDVGDDDLQHILDRAFARELNRRSTSITALRQALEEWHPDPGVGDLPPLDDEDADDDGEDDNVRTVMRASPIFLDRKPAAAPAPAAPPDDDDDDEDNARTMMRDPAAALAALTGGAPASGPATPAPGLAAPFGNPSAGFRPLGAGRPVAPARPAAGRPAEPAAPPISGRMPPPRMPPPAAPKPAPAPAVDDDDDDDVRTRMIAPSIDDEDSSDVRTKMRDPGAWLAGLGRPAAPPVGGDAPPPAAEPPAAPIAPAPAWSPPEEVGTAKTVAFPGGFDGAPDLPPEQPEKPGGLNLFAATKGPQLGPRGAMESGSYGRVALDAPPMPAAAPPMHDAMAPAPMAPPFGAPLGPQAAPTGAHAAPFGSPAAPVGPQAAPAFRPQPQGRSALRGLLIGALLAMLVVAALTFVFLRYRGLLGAG